MRRLAAVVALSLAGFVAALVTFEDAAQQACEADATPDRSYAAAFEPPVRAGADTHVVVVTRAGEPVTGARVCVALSSGDATRIAQGRETGAGRYRVALRFDAPGTWEGRVLVSDAAAPTAAVPVRVEVGP